MIMHIKLIKRASQMFYVPISRLIQQNKSTELILTHNDGLDACTA